MPYVDVRDVALAHVEAMENSKASGRYLCSGESIWSMEMAQILRDNFPDAKVPGMEMTGALMTGLMKFVFSKFSSDPQMHYVANHLGRIAQFNDNKLHRELGIKYRDVRPGWLEVVRQMSAAGLIKSLPASDSSQA